MFRGVNSATLDDKGRLAIPSRYRESLRLQADDRLIVTIDPEERCLLMYPLPDWEEIEEKLVNLPSFNQAARKVQRLLIGHAVDLNLDGNGRILVPTTLREYANIAKNVVLLGQGKKFEIWDEGYWYEQRELWLQDKALAKQALLPDDLKALSL